MDEMNFLPLFESDLLGGYKEEEEDDDEAVAHLLEVDLEED